MAVLHRFTVLQYKTGFLVFKSPKTMFSITKIIILALDNVIVVFYDHRFDDQKKFFWLSGIQF